MAESNKALLSWEFPEFPTHDRSKRWWIISGIIVVGFLVYAVLVANFLFALIIIMISAIVLYQHFHEPDMVMFGIYDNGLRIDDKHYRWSELKSFWLVYEPPVTEALYITFSSSLRPLMMIPLIEDINPLELRDILGEFVLEDLEKETEPTSEAIGKLLKL